VTPRTKELLSRLERVDANDTELANPVESFTVPLDYEEATTESGW
jgi:hypothetical protein